MMKRIALYPFLFVLYIILVPLSSNLDQVDASLSLRPLAFLLFAVAIGLLLLHALFKDWEYAAYIVFLAIASFFVFGHINRLIQANRSVQNKGAIELVLLGLWFGLFGIVSLKGLWSRINGRAWMLPFFNLVLAVALVRPGQIVLTHLLFVHNQPRTVSAQVELPNAGDDTLDCSSRPDIYYIILDAYGRDDVLDGMFNLNNRPFLDYLESKGFYVASQSSSNYMQTVFSIPSSLNYSYIDPPKLGVDGLEYFTNLVEDNRIMKALKRCGYQSVAIESGFFFTEHPGADLYLSGEKVLNDFESLLLAGSPWQVVADRLDLQSTQYSYEAHRQRVLYSFKQLGNLYKMPGPKMVFAHIISPHPPFVFDVNGKPVEPGRGYSMDDGDDFQGTLEEYRAGYAMQVQFVNQRLEQAIDAILANSPNPPVIIIQGDHGPGSHLDWSSPAKSCLWERTSILNAYYLPDGGRARLYPSISPVNSFRVVLNAYFKASLPLLPDRTYFTSHRLERQAIEITEDRTSHQNCTP